MWITRKHYKNLHQQYLNALTKSNKHAQQKLELLQEQSKLYDLTLAIITDHVPLEKRQGLFNILSAYKQHQTPKPPEPTNTAVIYATINTSAPADTIDILETLAKNCELTNVNITHTATYHDPNYPEKEYHTYMCGVSGIQLNINYFREKLKPISHRIE
jgi:hypothetical protein